MGKKRYRDLIVLKNEFIEIILTIKRMISNPLRMILHCLWIVISFQEEDYIHKAKQLAEEDKQNNWTAFHT